MTIDFEQEGAADLGLDLYEIAEEVISCALDYMDCPYEAQVGLLITDNEEIHRINKEQRGIDSATDVLSFPMTQYEVPGDFDFLEDEGIDCFEPDTGELMLGDIVISADKVSEQAEKFGHSVKREYAFLITHSILHLIGYDHMTPEEAAQMEALQEEILEKLNITR
ncbi:rRNA maturation RNase YbeY [Parablautia sp. Marseille-Q6255]|uniref:rRNA maturation RNase YbeY n=1 Tax=Parablautia sp. Marseille-Q6255 TaxID=3039593 RepID=UPI0024BD141F|nr:rRNA maturation RNase YbeY [Parablautia sp. Marseille-Q6255]